MVTADLKIRPGRLSYCYCWPSTTTKERYPDPDISWVAIDEVLYSFKPLPCRALQGRLYIIMLGIEPQADGSVYVVVCRRQGERTVPFGSVGAMPAVDREAAACSTPLLDAIVRSFDPGLAPCAA